MGCLVNGVGRPRLRPGEVGDPWVVEVIDKETGTVTGYQARVRVRDRDGRVRQVTATRRTKGAARRALNSRLAQRSDPGAVGVVGGMSVAQLGEYWMKRAAKGKLRHRRKDKAGAVRSRHRRSLPTEALLTTRSFRRSAG